MYRGLSSLETFSLIVKLEEGIPVKSTSKSRLFKLITLPDTSE